MSTKAKDTIWLVWADRGSYSDRTEYAVCWYAREDEAKAHADRMFTASEKWRRKVSDSWNRFGEAWDEAKKAIGDEQWSPSDETTYSAHALERGKKEAV